MQAFSYDVSEHLRQAAMAYPETSEGTSCVNRAFKVRKKNFLFVGEKDGEVKVMLKLSQSLDAARELEDPRIGVGGIGWVTVRFAPDDAPELDMLLAWVDESFRTLAPKTVLRQLDG